MLTINTLSTESRFTIAAIASLEMDRHPKTGRVILWRPIGYYRSQLDQISLAAINAGAMLANAEDILAAHQALDRIQAEIDADADEEGQA